MAPARRGPSDLLAAAALLGATLLLYRHVVALFWLYDTPFHLRLLSEHRLAEFFFSREPWRREKNVFTPLLFLSLAGDRALAGWQPWVFYVHQLAAIGGCAAALYAALRLWLPALFAAAGGALFVLGPAVAASAPVLMVRHYFESLALASLAVVAFVFALRGGRRAWTLVSAGSYLGALLAKEIAAPVIVLLALLPESDWRRRRRLLLPHGVALAAYAAYRALILDRPLASHGWVHPDGLPAVAAALPGKLLAGLLGGSPGVALLLGAGIAAALAAASRRALAVVAAVSAAALLPVLPVAIEMQPRFALAPWLVLSAGAACGWSRLASRPAGRRAAPWTVAATLVAAAAAGRMAWAGELALASRMSVENRAFLRLESDALLRHPASTTATLGEMSWLRARDGREGAAARWFQDDLHLCLRHEPFASIWTFDAASGAMRDVTAATTAAAAAWCPAFDAAAPLSARLWWDSGAVFWELGPHPDPGYSFVMDEGVTRIDVPRRGGYSWQGGGIAVRVRYEDAGGRVSYSPRLDLERGGGELRWRR
jgi:hypothetical protein